MLRRLRLRRAACRRNDSSLAASVPREVLFSIFGYFAQYQPPTQDLWLPRKEQCERSLNCLRAAMLVCRHWYSVAAVLHWHTLEPDAHGMYGFYNVVKAFLRYPNIASHARSITFPQEAKFTSFKLRDVPWKRRPKLLVVRARLKWAISDLLAACPGVTDMRMSTGAETLMDVYLLHRYTDRLTHLALRRPNHQFSFLRSLSQYNVTGMLELNTRGVVFPALEVLRLSHFTEILLPPSNPRMRLRDAFPRLQALILSEMRTTITDLGNILIELQPGLRILGFSSVYIGKEDYSSDHPHILDVLHMLPNEAIISLEDLRIRSSSERPVLRHWPLEPGHIDRFNQITHMAVHASILSRIELVPSALKELVCYFWEEDRSFSGLMKLVTLLVSAIPRWKNCAPHFRSYVNRAPNSEVSEHERWWVVSCLLHHVGRRSDVDARTDIWFNVMSIRKYFNIIHNAPDNWYDAFLMLGSLYRGWPDAYADM